MRKKKKSCGCNTQNNSCNTKNMNYCTKKEDVYQDKCSCVKPSDKCGCTKPMDKYNYTKPTDKCSCTKPVTEYNPKSCIPNTNINSIDSCKPTKCKPKIKEYTCPCEDCEITCEDKCADLAQRAEELFNKAMKYEEKAKCALKEAKELEQKIKKQDLDFEDFLEQMEQIQNMGPLDKILGMIPGMGNIKDQLGDVDLNGKEMKRTKAIVQSMTIEERRDPSILNASRKKRIARGSGTSVQDVNRLIKQFNEMKKMMKMFTGSQKSMKKRGGFPGLPFFK